jgi:hypothetical protein
MPAPRVDAERLIDFAAAVYAGAGMPEPDARLVADTLVQADLWGHQSHGVLRLGWYLDRIRNRVMNPVTRPEFVVDAGAIALIDGQDGVGHVLTLLATREAVRRAKTHGLGCVAVRNSNHFGTCMYYTLTGGGGQDTFVYYPGSGADTIVDFVSGSGASHDILDFSMLQGTDTLSNTLAMATQSGSDTIFDFGSGNTLTLQGVLKTGLVSADFTFGSAPLSTTFVPPRDFDADTHSDILWRNDDGSIELWEWNGTAVTDLSLGSAPTNEHILGMGDFNADDRSGDLLWRNDDACDDVRNKQGSCSTENAEGK